LFSGLVLCLPFECWGCDGKMGGSFEVIFISPCDMSMSYVREMTVGIEDWRQARTNLPKSAFMINE
jgi:hypothetical protein